LDATIRAVIINAAISRLFIIRLTIAVFIL